MKDIGGTSEAFDHEESEKLRKCKSIIKLYHFEIYDRFRWLSRVSNKEDFALA